MTRTRSVIIEMFLRSVHAASGACSRHRGGFYRPRRPDHTAPLPVGSSPCAADASAFATLILVWEFWRLLLILGLIAIAISILRENLRELAKD